MPAVGDFKVDSFSEVQGCEDNFEGLEKKKLLSKAFRNRDSCNLAY